MAHVRSSASEQAAAVAEGATKVHDKTGGGEEGVCTYFRRIYFPPAYDAVALPVSLAVAAPNSGIIVNFVKLRENNLTFAVEFSCASLFRILLRKRNFHARIWNVQNHAHTLDVGGKATRAWHAHVHPRHTAKDMHAIKICSEASLVRISLYLYAAPVNVKWAGGMLAQGALFPETVENSENGKTSPQKWPGPISESRPKPARHGDLSWRQKYFWPTLMRHGGTSATQRQH